ncbi:hypothetical protein Dsin_010429 [Dipteronia sinensis]|uniref:DUF4283 domain-containing protein n=1 Tax=Dipteronia sinensis TaxID=43782 RepID=A0AAE0ECU4_9ROSI|nr:hypothetical protein Dsin_010429 [Dipteronia sinensis]
MRGKRYLGIGFNKGAEKSDEKHESFSPGPSFAKVVRRTQKVNVNKGSEEKVEEVKWDVGMKDERWLKFCAVGVLKVFSDMSPVIKRLGNITTSTFYLGDKNILWLFQSIKDREVFVRNRFLWEDCFSSVGGWSMAVTPQSRMSWVEFRGIPLHCWCEDFFMRLGWALGEPLLVEEDTLKRRRLDRAMVLVLMPYSVRCPEKIKVVIGNRPFSVLSMEDQAPVNFTWLSRWLGLVKDDSADFLNVGAEKEKVHSCFENEPLLALQDSDGNKVGEGTGGNFLSNHSSLERLAEDYQVGQTRNVIGREKEKVVYCQNERYEEDGIVGSGQLIGGNFAVDLGCGLAHVEASRKGFAKVLTGLQGPILLEPDDNEEAHFLEEVEALAENVVINNGGMLKSASNGKFGKISSLSLKSHCMKTRSSSVHDKIQYQIREFKNKVGWSLEEEIVKVLEKGMALGFDFNGKKKELLEIINSRKKENDTRFHDLVKNLVHKFRSSVS